jgi:hypothetical protein
VADLGSVADIGRAATDPGNRVRRPATALANLLGRWALGAGCRWLWGALTQRRQALFWSGAVCVGRGSG